LPLVAHHVGDPRATVGQRGLDRFRVLDDVVVGQREAVGRADETRATAEQASASLQGLDVQHGGPSALDHRGDLVRQGSQGAHVGV
jgi:hypothetical protein